MPITVKLVGDLRRFVDSDLIELEDGPRTIAQAFAELSGRYPRLDRELFGGKGQLHYASVLMISGRVVGWPKDREAVIEEGGELLITRFHSGG